MAGANQTSFYDQRLETLPREELRKFQQRRFRKLLQQVLESNSFYRQKLQAAGIHKPIPLTGGFFGKFYIFRAALHADLVWLTVLGVLNSAIAAYYYLRVIVFMYMHTAAEQIPVERVRPAMGFVLIFSVAATFLLGIFPQAVLDFASQAAALLLENLGSGVL